MDERVDLSKYEDAYRDAPNTATADHVPDGTYQVIVASVELGRSKASGTPMLSWELDIIGGPCEGRKLWRRNMIASDENVKWLKADLYMAGLDLARLTDLQENLSKLLDVRMEVKKVTKGDFENVYFRSRIDSAMEGQATDSAPKPKEDLPF